MNSEYQPERKTPWTHILAHRCKASMIDQTTETH